MYLCRISFHCFCTKRERFINETSGNRGKEGGVGSIFTTYPAVPRVPKVSHCDIEANAESEGPGEDGGHIDTCILRGQSEKGVKGLKIEGGAFTVSLDERVVKGRGELARGKLVESKNRER